MKKFTSLSLVVLTVALAQVAHPQGGQGGGFGGGGFGGGAAGFGGQGGSQNTLHDRSVAAINASIAEYLRADPIKNILTPEGFSEWPLELKAGQVVIAEAYSESFDPMLEIARGEVVQASSDDRFPGDQRPLLLWRCGSDGNYSLRARSFRDKAGGQFHIGFRIYDTIDLLKPGMVDADVEEGIFLVRVPMAKGQIKQLVREVPDRYLWLEFEQIISPLGLPDANLARPIDEIADDLIVAPVAGDYYVMMEADIDGKLRVGTREVPPVEVAVNRNGAARTGTASLWKLNVKKGDVIELSTPGLYANSGIDVMEMPDFAKFDVSKPESNPFFPPSKDERVILSGAISQLPGRARDSRYFTFVANHDATLLIASGGSGTTQTYTMEVANAAIPFDDGKNYERKLTIGKTDYWVFDGKVGDVITFRSDAQAFASAISMYGPATSVMQSIATSPDETSLGWNLFVEYPGQYIVSMSCVGHGGGGSYTLAREAVSAKEFGINSRATGELKQGDVHVWKVLASPDEPMLVKWQSETWDYEVEIRTADGDRLDLPLTLTDARTKHAILSVSKPTTLLFVLKHRGNAAKYEIGFSSLAPKTK